jgi:hypothetical protein
MVTKVVQVGTSTIVSTGTCSTAACTSRPAYYPLTPGQPPGETAMRPGYE